MSLVSQTRVLGLGVYVSILFWLHADSFSDCVIAFVSAVVAMLLFAVIWGIYDAWTYWREEQT